MLRLFKMRAHLCIAENETPETDFERFALIRHYAGPSRLFDITSLSYKVDVQLRVSAAHASERRVFRRLMLNCAMEREDVRFSVSRAESLLSEALSSAIDQLMDDEAFRKNLR